MKSGCWCVWGGGVGGSNRIESTSIKWMTDVWCRGGGCRLDIDQSKWDGVGTYSPNHALHTMYEHSYPVLHTSIVEAETTAAADSRASRADHVHRAAICLLLAGWLLLGGPINWV